MRADALIDDHLYPSAAPVSPVTNGVPGIVI
jgi:hypothetical protein